MVFSNKTNGIFFARSIHVWYIYLKFIQMAYTDPMGHKPPTKIDGETSCEDKLRPAFKGCDVLVGAVRRTILSQMESIKISMGSCEQCT